MDLFDLDCHLTHGSLDPHESARLTASQLVHPLLHSTSVLPTHRQTHRQTTPRVTSVAIDRIYAMHALRPSNFVTVADEIHWL